MDLLAIENRPETCAALGLDCATCMRKSASSVASICGGLESQGLLQIFFQLYPSPACHAMAHAFESAYLDVAGPKVQPVLAAAAA